MRYLFLTTPKPGTSTERWLGKESGDYYFFNGGPMDNWDTRPDYIFTEETKQKTIASTELIDHIVSFIGLFLNLIHFIILTRKALRQNVVFIIIIGICVCDMQIFLTSITERLCGYRARRAPFEGFCETPKEYRYYYCEMHSKAFQTFGRLASAVLALSAAIIRTVSVLFPMSSFVDNLLKVRTGKRIFLVTWFACGVRYWQAYTDFGFWTDANSYNGRCMVAPEFGSKTSYIYQEGYIVMFLTVLYLIVTVFLLVALGMTQRRRKKLGNDKGSSTSMLVVMMAVSFLISESIYSIRFLIDNRYDLENQNKVIEQIIDVFNYVIKIILNLNSIFHCFICFFLSSQYREVVWKLFRLDKRKQKTFTEPATNSTAGPESSTKL